MTVNDTPIAPPASERAAQKAAFDRDGFLIVRNAVPPDILYRVMAAADRLAAEGIEKEGLSARHHWQMRNCIVADPAFLDLLDLPTVLPLVTDLLDWDIHLITSHLIVRPPSPPGTNEFFKGEGWHRDGGNSPRHMQEPHPRLFLKVAFFLSDQSEPGRGNTMVVPGSNRLIGPLAQSPEMPHPYGAIDVCGKPGDAFLFENRTWHGVGPNYADVTRKTLFMGYGYRWVRAMDYQMMPESLLASVDPIRWQLLGGVKSPMGIYLPTDEDVPIRRWKNSGNP
ncbi:MAG: phytanoyl-CoA dioxygenase family protein [Capsulimonadales bacterium]|nr:phytanoyl-CoA dioxygenase family protein [Capsulimonadales bacterium]